LQPSVAFRHHRLSEFARACALRQVVGGEPASAKTEKFGMPGKALVEIKFIVKV
jgi:hypothetical protein